MAKKAARNLVIVVNAILGKETIDMYNTGQSKGSQESYNMNYQKLGKDLMYIQILIAQLS